MKRFAMDDLLKWKEKQNRKPLIIRGAHRVGKTWLMREFGRVAYKDVVYVSFADNDKLRRIFDGKLIPDRLIVGLELYLGRDIDPDGTLLIFDDIQESSRALESLRYFREQAPAYHIVCGGSFAGTTLPDGTLFPVDNIEFLDLYPLSFLEFAAAAGMERYVPILLGGDFETAGAFSAEYIDLLKQYLFVGGMPEAVQTFVETNDLTEVRETQKRILDSYEQVVLEHAPDGLLPRIRAIWGSVPAQLAKENRKFVYGLMEKGARAKDYERALRWLVDGGFVSRVNRLDHPALPLTANEDRKAFKLYLPDVGLLGCMTGLQAETLPDGDRIFRESNGALTEQYVFQQLKVVGDLSMHYWTPDKGTASVDFVLSDGRSVIPVEINAEKNLQTKSLKVYCNKYAPSRAIRLSLSDYKDAGLLVNVPLYAAGLLLSVVY